MQFTKIALLALSAISVVHADCNSTGQKGEAKYVDPKVPLVCSALKGYFLKDEKRHICIMDESGQQWDFTLKYIGDGDDRWIESAECENGFKKETSCDRGGKTGYANWWYNADPNVGSCFGYTS